MSRIRIAKPWDVDRGEATPQAAYLRRREFLRRAGLAGAGLLGVYGCRPKTADEKPAGAEVKSAARPVAQPPPDLSIEDTVKPVPGSAFHSCDRNARYTVNRPTTDELVAARYNNFYEFGTDKESCWRQAQRLTVRPWTIDIGGLVAKPMTIGIDDLIRKMPCEERLYRFRCVERWAMVVPWSGFPFAALMKLVEPMSAAKFVRFVSFLRPSEAVGQGPGSGWNWPYYEGLTLAEAANELAFVATGLYGHDLPKQHGAPFRMVLPWKYGYKGAKSIVKIEFMAERPKTFWNDYAANEYGFYSNVNPKKPHPRWSQAREWMIGTKVEHDTQLYNGYGEYVAAMYTGDEH